MLINILPELNHLRGLHQNPAFHKYDAFEHTMVVLDNVPKDDLVLRYAALFHDIAKGTEGVRTYKATGQPQDIGHEFAGIDMTKDILKRFGYGQGFINDVAFLVKEHMSMFKVSTDKARVKKVFKWATALKNRTRLVEAISRLMILNKADLIGCGVDVEQNLERQEAINAEVWNIINNRVLFISELAINGNDILEIAKERNFGIKGERVGEMLGFILDEVYRQVYPNDREVLIQRVIKRLR